MGHKWIPIKVGILEGTEQDSKSDFPHLVGNLLVMNHKAKDVMYPLIRQHGELLPLKSQIGEFYTFNVTTVIDCLDEELSEMIRFPDGRIMHIVQYGFFEDQLQNAVIFRIPQFPNEVYITDIFANEAKINSLIGLELEPIWESDS